MKIIILEGQYSNLRKVLYKDRPSIKEIIRNIPSDDKLAFEYALSHLEERGITKEKFLELIKKQKEILKSDPVKLVNLSGIGTEVAYLDLSNSLAYALDLSNNSLDYFPPEHLPVSLKLLYTFGNKFPDSYFEELNKKRPNLEVMNQDLPF